MNFILKYISKIQDAFHGWIGLVLSGFFPGRILIDLIKRSKVFSVLKAHDRISSLDIFRAFAILGVVIYHFHHFHYLHRLIRYGTLGVDLFFVISGLLVGGILTREFEQKRNINYLKFILQRGFKIWPSYYLFLIFGNFMAFLFLRNSDPSNIIPFGDFTRYVFYYQNYIYQPEHWSFGHVWSLCVEEQFYIVLPVLFILIQVLFKSKNQLKALYGMVFVAIILGIVSKYYSFFYTVHKDTYLGTQYRMDALAWGVLLNLIITYYGNKLRNNRFLPILFFLGAACFITVIRIDYTTTSEFFHKVVLRSVVPPCFFLMILGAYYLDFSRFYLLRMIGYYSYNWYLWHPLFMKIIADDVNAGMLGLGIYICLSLSMAILTTIIIEEPFLRLRKKVIPKLFNNVIHRKQGLSFK